MSLAEAAQAIAAAKDSLPSLCDSCAIDPEGVEAALAFLYQCKKGQTPNVSTSVLRDVAQQWACWQNYSCVIGDCELLAAAIWAGFQFRWDNAGDVLVGVSEADLRRLRKEVM